MGIYNSIYNILQGFLFGSEVLTSEMSLTLTLCSSVLSVVAVALPFLAVLSIARMVFGLFRW